MNNLKISFFTIISSFFLPNNIEAQKSNIESRTFNVSGNCGMCKSTIEKAAMILGVKSATWDESKKSLQVQYNKQKTNPESVLRSVAYAGYDNEKYLAPEAAYKKLHACCQYERSSQPIAETAKQGDRPGTIEPKHENNGVKAPETDQQAAKVKEKGIKELYNSYFQVKDALVKSNSAAASELAGKMLVTIDKVNMEALTVEEHKVYMKFAEKIRANAKSISENKNIEAQRSAFTSLSSSMFELMRVIKPGYEVYLDHCPMYNDGKGADWISKEKQIKNPYYGSKMLTCGNVKETIK
jgi:hypothetical protein